MTIHIHCTGDINSNYDESFFMHFSIKSILKVFNFLDIYFTVYEYMHICIYNRQSDTYLYRYFCSNRFIVVQYIDGFQVMSVLPMICLDYYYLFY